MSTTATLTLAQTRRHIGRRAIWSRVVIASCYGAALLVILPLALIVWHLIAKGLPALSLSFFVDMPKPVGEAGGGMANAIVGTLILVGLGALFPMPVGLGAGRYRHGQHARGRARGRRDGTLALHRAREPLLVHLALEADRLVAGLCVRLRAGSVR